MRVTDQARRALVLAAEAARDRGDKAVGGHHVLLGLAGAEGSARHVLGSSSERLRAVPPSAATLDAESSADVRLPFVTARDIVNSAIERARASGRDQATTADILFAALDPADGPVTSLLRAAGAEPATVRASLAEGDHGACCQETGVSEVRTLLAEMGSHADGLPGRGRAAAGMVGGLIPYALLWCTVLAVTWDTSGPELVLALGAATVLLSALLAPVFLRRRVHRSLAYAPTTLPMPESMRPLLDRLGLQQLEVRIQPAPAQDRCYRLGRRAWIVLGSGTERHRELAHFVLWHEVAHLARRDGAARRLSARVGVGLVVGAMGSFDLRAAAIAVTGTAMLIVAGRWWSEAACDRIAVRQAGPAALHAWAAAVSGTLATLRRQKERPRRARVKDLLSHPPLALRTALHPNTSHQDENTEHDQAVTV